MNYINFYQCPRCNLEWADEHDCTCDDRCPECNLSVSPYESTDKETYEIRSKIRSNKTKIGN